MVKKDTPLFVSMLWIKGMQYNMIVGLIIIEK